MKRSDRRGKWKWSAGTAAILAALCLSACGGGEDSSAYDPTMLYSANKEAGMAAPGAMAYEETAANYSAENRSLDAAADSEGVSSGSSGLGDAPEDSTPSTDTPLEKKLIRNADLEFETENFDEFLRSLEAKIQMSHGYIESSNIYGSEQYQTSRSASYTVRIPTAQLDDFLEYSAGAAHLIRKSVSTQDITLSYHDTELRKETLRTEQQRLLELMAQAESMEAVIALESRLSEIRYELSSLESDLRLYDNQVQYSTVYIEIQERAIPTPTIKAGFLNRVSLGFRQSFGDVAEGLVDFSVFLLSSIPQLVVLAVIFLLLFLLGRRILKGFRNRRQKALTERARLGYPIPPQRGFSPAAPVPIRTANAGTQTPAGSPSVPQETAAGKQPPAQEAASENKNQ